MFLRAQDTKRIRYMNNTGDRKQVFFCHFKDRLGLIQIMLFLFREATTSSTRKSEENMHLI